MSDIMLLRGGVWSKNFLGHWVFFTDPGDHGYGVIVERNLTYNALVDLVKQRYEINAVTPIMFTYHHRVTPEGSYITPIEVETDAHVDLYLDVRRSKPALPLFFTTGANAIAEFHQMSRRSGHNNGGGFGYVPYLFGNDLVPPHSTGGISNARVAATQMLVDEMFTEDERRLINRIHMEREVNQSLHLAPSPGNMPGLVPRDYRSNDVVIIIDADDADLEKALGTQAQEQCPFFDEGGPSSQAAVVPNIRIQNLEVQPNPDVVAVPEIDVPPVNNNLNPPYFEHLALWTEFNNARASERANVPGGLRVPSEESLTITAASPPTGEGHNFNSMTFDPGFLHENSSTGSSDDLLLLLDAELERFRDSIVDDPLALTLTQPSPPHSTGEGLAANPNASSGDQGEMDVDGGPGSNISMSSGCGLGGKYAGEQMSTGSGNDVVMIEMPANAAPTQDKGIVDGQIGEATQSETQLPIVSLSDDSDFENDPLGEYANNPDEVRVGMRFKNRGAFKAHMGMYAVKHKFQYKTFQSKPARMVLICNGVACPWRVYAVRLGDSDVFEVRRATLQHNCTVDERRNYQRQATTTVIGDMLRARYVGPSMGPRPNEIRELLRGAHDVRISYWKAWHAREVAIDSAKGTAQNSYTLLPSYLVKLAHANPGTIVQLQTEKTEGGDERFKYLFIAFGACIKGFPYMRKVVVIDGTHLTGKYAGCLLTAVAQDGNYGIFPLGFAVVDSENDKAWEWFFQNLSKFVTDGNDLVFVSDRHGSIYAGLQKVFPNAHHCACVLHLKRNVKTYFKNRELGYLVKRAAYAYRVADFGRLFTEITRIDNECAEYLKDIGFPHWTRAHFPGNRYNIMTSNLAESWNAAIREAREFPISALVEHIRSKLMEWFSERRKLAEKMTSTLTTKIESLLAEHFEESAGFDVKEINKGEYEVRDKSGFSFHVDLNDKGCSCFEFQKLQIPCSHALAAATKGNIPVDSLVGEEFGVKNMRAAYAVNINPAVEVNEMDAIVDELAKLCLTPPATKRPPGRPRKKRFLSRGEHRLRGIRRPIVCSRCKGGGHNRATCKMPI